MTGADLERLEGFERMLRDVQRNYAAVTERMEHLKVEGKTKTVTFRQLLGDKLLYQTMLAMYRAHGLIE